MNNNIRKFIMAALCLALCIVLPFLTGQIPEIGNVISPMHIPALLCGFICGWPYALAVGFIAPILRSAMFGMPPMFPKALAMAFELAAYGAFSGILYSRLPKSTINIYVSLIGAMLLGRLVWGIASLALYGISGGAFTFALFITNGFVKAIPAIIIHIVIIPLLVMALKKANLIENNQRA